MLVPVAVLAILVIMGLASRSLFGTANRPVFLVLLILVLLVMSGLRSETVGMDTQRYYASFNDFLAMDREEAAEFISTQKDAGYYWFSWAFGKVIPDVHVWFMFVSAVYLIGIALVCYWESPDYAFSMLYMYTMGMFFFSMTGLRQALAMGIALTSYAFLAKRQFIPFVIIVGVASIFHQSAIAFMFIYPIARMRSGWLRLVLIMGFFLLIIAFKDSVARWIFNILPDSLLDARLSGYVGSEKRLTASGFVIQLLMFVFCLRYRSRIVADEPHREVLYNLASVSLVFQAAAMAFAEFFRVGMYFGWSFMVLIPICMQYEAKDRSYEFIRMAVMVALIAYFFYSTVKSYGVTPYSFFWEGSVI
ncbi:MAG: EpsG family protein [Clostridia bacterium]|nr:EpsG family protein [Clostridia bacterium]